MTRSVKNIPALPAISSDSNDPWPTFVLSIEQRKKITANGLSSIALQVTGTVLLNPPVYVKLNGGPLVQGQSIAPSAQLPAATTPIRTSSSHSATNVLQTTTSSSSTANLTPATNQFNTASNLPMVSTSLNTSTSLGVPVRSSSRARSGTPSPHKGPVRSSQTSFSSSTSSSQSSQNTLLRTSASISPGLSMPKKLALPAYIALGTASLALLICLSSLFLQSFAAISFIPWVIFVLVLTACVSAGSVLKRGSSNKLRRFAFLSLWFSIPSGIFAVVRFLFHFF